MPFLLSGCLGTQHLKDNQKRLIQQSIKAPKEIDQEALRNLYAQRPNRRLLGLPIYHLVAIYYWGERNYDREKYIRKKDKVEQKFDRKISRTSSQRKLNNLQFRKQKKIAKLNSFIESGNNRMQWGEKVAVFDSALVDITVNRFKNYLAGEGYFQNSVTTKTATIGKFVSLTYLVDVDDPYMIDSVVYSIPDSGIFELIKKHEDASLIKKGSRYREDNLSNERERIDLLLKDRGYYDFSRQYIQFPVDTSLLGDNKIAVMIQILNPAKRGYHKQFRIDSVRFTTDAGVNVPGMTRQTRTYREIQYRYYEDHYNLKILGQRIFLSPGALYSRTKTFASQRQLANLDAFKFVNINYDTSGGKFIANIFTSPLDRYELSNEIGVNVTQGFPGPFFNVNFKKRNIFRGLENFELNGRLGIEGVASATEQLSIFKSTEAGLNASLIFPQFLWPFRNATQIRLGQYNPKTRVTVGYTYSDRIDYRRAATSFSSTYTWQNERTTQFSVALFNVSLINSEKSSEFEILLDSLEDLGNYNLARSFQPSFVSSMIFGVTWNKNYGSSEKDGVFIRAQFEPGGTSLNFVNTDLITGQGLQYFKFLRFNFDYRKIKRINPWMHFAYRVNTGVAYSYGSNGGLPYEKYYFAGGSNSVRAWRPRRLGVGSVPPVKSGNPEVDGLYNYQFEKPGEILLEGSAELRGKLFGFIDGAMFVDVGNVWLFNEQISRDEFGNEIPGEGSSKFEASNFYKQLGVGTGFGLRFDFTFLILRFDIGIKVYDPGRPANERFVLDDVRFFKPYATSTGEAFTNFKEPVIYNVGIGYPF